MVRVYQDPKAPMLAGRRRWCIDCVDLNGKRRRMRTIATHASKSHKVRHVPINAVVREILDCQAPFIGPDGPSPYVFVNPDTGRPYRAHSVSHAFKGAAGLDDVVFHTLRHTCVSRLVQAGVPDGKIMKMIGRSSPHMVSRYAHLAPDSLQGMADVLLESGKKGTRHTFSGVGNPLATKRGQRQVSV